MVERVVRLLQDRSLRSAMGAAGMRRITEHFALERTADAYLRLYDAQDPTSAPAA